MTDPQSVGKDLRVVVIGDDKNIRQSLSLCLEQAGCEVHLASSGQAAVAVLERHPFDLAFLDLRLGGERGEELIPHLLALGPGLPIVVITAHATVDTAVETLRRGAWDYLPKPFSPDQIRQVLNRLRERGRLTRQVAELERQLALTLPELDVSSESAEMHRSLEIIDRAARAEASVLLRGETGTGKTAFARALHAKSHRRANPFVVINCPTLAGDLPARELFGHAGGSFIGAARDQPGRVEAADGGTLFLDEIGEIPLALQAKLLRFIQERQFERVGETETRRADVRIVAATHRNIEEDIADGLFREDLFFRLNVIEIPIPPLRQRPEDILPLARHFVNIFACQLARPAPQLSGATEALLLSYRWPGNVRELRNAIERALILWPGVIIEPGAFPERMAGVIHDRPAVGGDFSLEEIERAHIVQVVERVPTFDRAAEILQIDATTLWRKRKKFE